MEVSKLIKKVKMAHDLCLSYEKADQFKGLKKRYKYNYDNIINLSLYTDESIEEEYKDKFKPSEPY